MPQTNKLIIFYLSVSFFLFGCTTIPDKVTAVKGFDKSRYLGKWYEVARFDFRFEKDLINTTAQYSLRKNGNIEVINCGFNIVSKKWKQAKGKAKFVGEDTVGMLKVSFFGPFYGGYNVIEIDEAYQYSLVCGSSVDYLWILSREKTIPEDIKARYVARAKELGFDTDKLLWVQQD